MSAITLHSVVISIGLSLIALVSLSLICYVLYFLVSLPLRRQERARILIDLLELQEHADQDPAGAIKRLSQTQDPSLGVRFHILGAYLEAGRSLSESLKLVPQLLPDTLTGSLIVGERLGSLRPILPVCQTQLRDAASTVQNVTRYLILTLFLALFLAGTLFSVTLCCRTGIIAFILLLLRRTRRRQHLLDLAVEVL